MPKHKAEAYALQPVLVPQQHQYTVYASAVTFSVLSLFNI